MSRKNPPQAASGPKAPLYEVVMNALRDDINARRFDNAGILPAESELSARFGVSRITVRRALDELARAGLVERSQGRTTRVVQSLPPVVIDLTKEIATTLARSEGLVIKVLGFKWVKPNPVVIEALGVAPTEKVLWVTRIRSREEQPIVHTSVHLPQRLGELVTKAELGRRQLLDVLKERGQVAASAEQVLSAAPCPPALEAVLALKPGEPIFRLNRILYDQYRNPMLVLESSFRWDCMAYKMSLRQDALSINNTFNNADLTDLADHAMPAQAGHHPIHNPKDAHAPDF